MELHLPFAEAREQDRAVVDRPDAVVDLFAQGAEGPAARRILASLYPQMAFYLPRQLEERGEKAFAEGVRAVAADIRK